MRQKKSLAETHPDIAAQWHPDNDMSPFDVTAGSRYRAKWVCDKDQYVWESAIYSRTINGSGCPFCAGKVVIEGVNDLATTHPDKAAEWHADNSKKATEVSAGAGYRAKWQCLADEQHVWETAVCNRTGPNTHTDCPYCSKRKLLPGNNDLETTHPKEASEWGDNPKPPSQYTSGSREVVNWECRKGHKWRATIQSRVSSATGCGVCSGWKLLSGVNDVKTLHPKIAEAWSGRNKKSPSEYLPGSSDKVWLTCELGHDWKAAVHNIVRGGWCPYCANKKVLAGFNDVATTFPEIVQRWSKDNDKTPQEVTRGSFYEAKLICDAGHVWKTKVATYVRGHCCPYCSGRSAVKGETDVNTTHPHLVTEWDADNEFTPYEVSAGSDRYVNWVCHRKRHKWRAQVKHRALRGQGCPTCYRSTFTSQGEKELAEYIESIVGEDKVFRNHRKLRGVSELDVYVPEMNIAFEFNGVYWHSEGNGVGKFEHQSKLNACRSHGVRLIVIWEDDWNDRREVVKKMVMAKLGRAPRSAKGARHFTVDVSVPKWECDLLLSSEHIQGPVNGTARIGLRDKDGALHAVMVGVVRKGNMELVRYASKTSVTGGFARLLRRLEHAASQLNCTNIITYSDNSVSDGALYMSHGFVKSHDVEPKYGIVHRTRRYHSSVFTRKRFRNDPKLKEGHPSMKLTDLYSLNGIHRVWDYGKVCWTKYIPR